MESYQVNVDGNDIQVMDYPGDGGTIVMIHGLTGTHRNMHYYAERYKRHYRVVSLDLRGRGNSDPLDREPSIFKHAADIIGLLRVMQIENPILVGHSMGAFISALVASELDSVQAVVLLDGAAEMSEHQQEIVKPSLGRLSKEYGSKEQYVEEIRAIYAKLGISWNDTMQKTVEYEVEKIGDHWENKSDEAGILADFDSFYEFRPEQVCAGIDCPVLLVYAESGIGAMPPLFYLSDYDKTKDALKDLEIFISDSSHYTMVFEQREDIYRAMDKFLENN
ncbi:alpha/beta fold hydrolase [Planococcus lenghuensis]|uniref:Alpha/beta hydrolase n=1 Tax=Planococcus lenghuensis TaxID=2213202 RepID=A0A1Q2L2F7_9BACL|nr:alpha/beta hydrolase [Planococcus lenghuensis]AQQ54645.1 alpha/beta hydrolase [Planococcus lenghuensis]